MKKKGIIIIGLLLISICTIPFVIFSLQFFALVDTNGGGVLPPPYDTPPSKPILSDIQPDPDTDGVINLDWSDSSNVVYYNVYRSIYEGGSTKIIIGLTSSSFIDRSTKKNRLYYYKIEAVNNIGKVSSYWKSVNVYISPPTLIYPTNPSIIINDDGTPGGANNTNSFDVVLTLSCENADEMQFQISTDQWLNWTAYKTIYPLTLLENDPDSPNYRIAVVFRNENGTSVDAGYKNIYDDIIYDSEGEPPPVNGDDEIDYTLIIYVLLGVLVGLIGIGVFLKVRKKKTTYQRRIKYFEKKDKKRQRKKKF